MTQFLSEEKRNIVGRATAEEGMFPKFMWATCPWATKRREARWRFWSRKFSVARDRATRAVSSTVVPGKSTDEWISAEDHGVASRDSSEFRRPSRECRQRAHTDDEGRIADGNGIVERAIQDGALARRKMRSETWIRAPPSGHGRPRRKDGI